MPRGHRVLGQRYFARFENDEGDREDPTELVLLRKEPGAEDGEWVFGRPLTPLDDQALATSAPTTQGRTILIIVERTEHLYLRDTQPGGWAGETIHAFGFQAGEVFQFDAIKDLPLTELPAAPVAIPALFVIDEDVVVVEVVPPAAPALPPAAALGAAPMYAAGMGGPPPWQPPTLRPAMGAAVEVPVGVAPADWAMIVPHLSETITAAFRHELTGVTQRLTELERAVQPVVKAEVPLPPGTFFAQPAQTTPVCSPYPQTPGVAAYGNTAGVDAVVEARALLGGSVASRAATSQSLRVSADSVTGRGGTTRAGTAPLTVQGLLQLLTSRDDISSLLESDGVLGGVAGASGAKGLAALERARCEFEANPKALWSYVMGQILRLTRVRGGGLLAYFQGTAVQNHEFALFLLHLVDRISTAALEGEGDMVLGLCASAITFLDQAARDSFSLRLATELSLIRDPELPYLGPETDADKRQRGRYGKPFSPLVNPTTYAAVTAAFKDIETLTKASAPPKGKGKGGA